MILLYISILNIKIKLKTILLENNNSIFFLFGSSLPENGRTAIYKDQMFSYIQNQIIMNRNQDQSSCRKYLKQAILIILILLFLVVFYSLDGSILTIGSLNKNITAIKDMNLTVTSCSSVCHSPYNQPLNDAQCCQDSLIISSCKSKEECSLEIITTYQNQLNNEYSMLLLLSGIELFIILIITVYCVKKRMQRIKRMREAQQGQNHQENQNAALFNIVGSLRIRREYEPATLKSSFLNKDSESSCSICLESLLEAKAIKLKCHHIFHSQCIKQWMQTRNTCPICRTKN